MIGKGGKNTDGITDDYMRETLRSFRSYTMVVLHRTSKRNEPGSDSIVWEHGRRNFMLRKEGLLCIVCPANKDDSDVAGLCIFSTDLGETTRLMDHDPAVEAGVLTYEAHSIEGFPGDSLSV